MAAGPGHGQPHRGQHGGVPGAEVLGRVVPVRHLAQVVVDVGRADVVPALPAAEGQQFVLGAAPAALELGHHRADLGVGHELLAVLGRLAGVVEHQLPAVAGDVLLADGGQPERAVLSRVLLPTDPEEAQVDQADGGGQDPVAGQLVARSGGVPPRSAPWAGPGRTPAPGRAWPCPVRPATGRGSGTGAGPRRPCPRPGCDRRARGEIQTSSQAGGMTRARTRFRVSGSVSRVPSAAK